jgi:Uma2 family endonuclease
MQSLVFESTRTVTPEEFGEWVEARERAHDDRRSELLNGRIVMTPPAGYPHGLIEARLVHVVSSVVRERRLGDVFGSSQGFALPSGDTVEPDVSFVSKERWAAAPPPENGKFIRVVPSLVFEILSTSTASRDRGEKKAIYEKNGVSEYWLVDFYAREALVFQLEGDRYGKERVYSGAERAVSGVVKELVIELADVFP